MKKIVFLSLVTITTNSSYIFSMHQRRNTYPNEQTQTLAHCHLEKKEKKSLFACFKTFHTRKKKDKRKYCYLAQEQDRRVDAVNKHSKLDYSFVEIKEDKKNS